MLSAKVGKWFEDSQGQEYGRDVVRAGSLNYVVIYESKSPIHRELFVAFTRRARKICVAIYYLINGVIMYITCSHV